MVIRLTDSDSVEKITMSKIELLATDDINSCDLSLNSGSKLIKIGISKVLSEWHETNGYRTTESFTGEQKLLVEIPNSGAV